jgi:hypothetical protein
MQKYYKISKITCHLLAIIAIICLLAVNVLNMTGTKFIILTTIASMLAIASCTFFVLTFSRKPDDAKKSGATKKEQGTARRLGD